MAKNYFNNLTKTILRSFLRLIKLKHFQLISFNITQKFPEISSFYSWKLPENSLKFKFLLFYIFRTIKLNSLNYNEIINKTFNLLRYFNEKNIYLNSLYENYLFRLYFNIKNYNLSSSLSSSSSNSLASSSSVSSSSSTSISTSSSSSTNYFIKVGEIVEHKLFGYRGVCNYWTIESNTNKQIISLLIDWYDYDQILNNVMPSTFYAEDFNIVRDPRFTRIHHNLISDFFTRYDPILGIYIPNYSLTFSHPNDMKNILEIYHKQPIFIPQTSNKLKIKKSFINSTSKHLFLSFDYFLIIF